MSSNQPYCKQIDYNKLAQETNMSNPRSAANAWGTIKKKMAWSTGATPAAPKSAASKSAAPKSTGKRKKTAPASADGDEDDTEDANVAAVTPTAKKAKKTPAVKTPRKKATPKSEARAKESSDEAEGEGSNADKQVKGEPGVKEEPKGDNEDEGLI